MKKIYALLLAVTLMLALTACSDASDINGEETDRSTSIVEEEQSAQFIVRINTEGMGQIAYAKEGEALQFDDEYPAQSAYFGETEAQTYVVSAKADEGWKFVKWTKDGEDFSTDDTITIELSEANTEYIAVFEAE